MDISVRLSEDEYDIAIADEAYRKFKENPVTYSHEEVWKELLD